MIGALPGTLEVSGTEYRIRSDFRIALLIFEAFGEPDYSDSEKLAVCLECLYEEIPPDTEEAYAKAQWFLDGGDAPKAKPLRKKIIDWKQDEHMIFPAVNKTAGFEVRSCEYLHWWTFLGYFGEIGDGLFSQVMNIRTKKAKRKKLEKWEQEFLRNHREIIELKTTYAESEKAEINRLNAMLDSKNKT